MGSLRDAVGYITDWRSDVFPEQTPGGARNKLFREIWEFMEDDSAEELVDLFITLINYADLAFTLPRFEKMVAEKMAINMSREWDELDDGSFQHRDGDDSE